MPSPREEGYTGGQWSVKATQKFFRGVAAPIISASGRKIFRGPTLTDQSPR